MNKNKVRKLIFRIVIIICSIIIIVLFIFSRHPISKIHQNKISNNTEYSFPTEDTPIGVKVDSASLLENANLWNGRVITFVGEAIGENIARVNMAWIHLNDDKYMDKNIEEGAAPVGYNSGHAVWLPLESSKKIRFFGDYKHRGDIVKVTGTFNSVCKEHGGDMDIHTASMEILETGYSIDHKVKINRIIIALFLLLGAGFFYGIQRIVVRR